jgi:PHD/YefM family antitoxin component YafN of YafNO toxin-antitoxin module
MLIERAEIISATEMTNNYANCRKKAKSNFKIIIFKNNKPDLALVDIDEFEKMINKIEFLENLLIANMNEGRSRDDNGATELLKMKLRSN